MNETTGRLTEGEVIGLAIRRVRQRRQKSMRAVERDAGLGQGALSPIERGKRQPRWGTIRRVAQSLGVQPKEIAEEVEAIERMGADG